MYKLKIRNQTKNIWTQPGIKCSLKFQNSSSIGFQWFSVKSLGNSMVVSFLSLVLGLTVVVQLSVTGSWYVLLLSTTIFLTVWAISSGGFVASCNITQSSSVRSCGFCNTNPKNGHNWKTWQTWRNFRDLSYNVLPCWLQIETTSLKV